LDPLFSSRALRTYSDDLQSTLVVWMASGHF
jgi:hypothetical protein